MMTNQEMNTPVLLEAKGISKYFGGIKAVDGVNMQIREGDIFGIIGPNGAGKTTFFNMCTGIFVPTKGKIFFCGEDITAMNAALVAKKRIARTFQNLQIFKFMTVQENVKIGCHIKTKSNLFDAVLHTKTYKQDEDYTNEKSMQILKRIGLEEYADTLAGNMSYGMQRKVEIARALALDPKILLLDEPAAGMNPPGNQQPDAVYQGSEQGRIHNRRD